MGVDGDGQRAAELQPNRYYLLGDAGSFFFEPGGDNDGFESPEAAAEGRGRRLAPTWTCRTVTRPQSARERVQSEPAVWECWEGGDALLPGVRPSRVLRRVLSG